MASTIQTNKDFTGPGDTANSPFTSSIENTKSHPTNAEMANTNSFEVQQINNQNE